MAPPPPLPSHLFCIAMIEEQKTFWRKRMQEMARKVQINLCGRLDSLESGARSSGALGLRSGHSEKTVLWICHASDLSPDIFNTSSMRRM